MVVACLLSGWTVTGCDDNKPVGPKRADHEAAHRRGYHPDVARRAASTAPATRPAGDTDLSDLRPASRRLVGKQGLRVNNDIILVHDVLEPIIEDLREKARILSPADYDRHVRTAVRDQIHRQIHHAVVYQEARHAFPSDEIQKLFEQEAEDMIRHVQMTQYGGLQARYEAHLASLGMTMSDARERARRHAMVLGYLHKRFMPLQREPTRRELERYYRANLARYTTPAKAELFLIEVAIQGENGRRITAATPPEAAEEARRRAFAKMERIREELLSGVDFAEVARTYSDGLRAAGGGAWGEISPGDLTQRWAKPAEVLFTLRENELSEVVETPDALFLVKCGAYTPETRLSFEEAQKDIVGRLVDRQFEEWSSTFVSGLVERAAISEQDWIAFAQAVLAACPPPQQRRQTAFVDDLDD